MLLSQCSRHPCIQIPQTKPAQVLLSSPVVRHLVGTVAKMAAALVFNHDRDENQSTLEMGYKKNGSSSLMITTKVLISS